MTIRVHAVTALACACWVMVPASAAVKSTSKTQEAVAHRSTIPEAWPPETLMGTIVMVDPAAKLVVIQDRSGIPYDLQITPSTHVFSGNQRLDLRDLSMKTNDNVSVRFIPERRGDVAKSIQVG